MWHDEPMIQEWRDSQRVGQIGVLDTGFFWWCKNDLWALFFLRWNNTGLFFSTLRYSSHSNYSSPTCIITPSITSSFSNPRLFGDACKEGREGKLQKNGRKEHLVGTFFPARSGMGIAETWLLDSLKELSKFGVSVSFFNRFRRRENFLPCTSFPGTVTGLNSSLQR